MLRAARALVPTIFALTLFSIAAWVLRENFQGRHLDEVLATIRSIPTGRLALALVLTGASYVLLTAYDELALRLIGRKIAYRKIAFASFVSYAFGNNLGFTALTCGSVRLRFYRESGLRTSEIVAMTAVCSLTFWLGFLAVVGSVFLLFPPDVSSVLPLPFHAARLIGGAFLVVLLTYYLWCARERAPVILGRFHVPTPPLSFSVTQTVVASAEIFLVAGVIFVLLPPSAQLGFPHFLSLFLLAHMSGLISQVPGGVGVFETVLLTLLPSGVHESAIFGVLLVYRIIYNLLPLTLAALLVVSQEMHAKRHHLGGIGRLVRRWL